MNEAIKTLAPEDRRARGQGGVGVQGGDRRRDRAPPRRDRSSGGGAAAARGERLDLTAGGHGRARGHLHLVTQVQRELEDIFVGLGYRVAEGPEVEDDWHNFEALNIPPAHPARSMQDTLYVRLGRDEQVMLRTHTSPVQIRTMESERAADLRRRARAHVPQRDARRPRTRPCSTRSSAWRSTGASRSPTCSARSRCSSSGSSTTSRSARASAPTSSRTPSRRPSWRCSCIFCHGEGCRVCSHTGWIELGGCGMVDPNVFEAVGLRPGGVAGLRVRLRPRADRDDPLRHRRDPHVLRRRRPLPRSVLMH